MKKKLWILALPFAVVLLVAATVNKYFGQFTGTFFGDGAGVTNVVSTNLLAGTNLWTGTNTWTVGTRTLKHGGTTTVITNTTTLTSTEWGDGFEKHWYNGTNFVSIQKTNGNMIVGGSLTVSNGLTLAGPGGGVSLNTNLSVVGTLTSEGSTLWGNYAHTNGVTVNSSGQILSNALGSVTISSGNITNTGTIASGGFMSPTNGVMMQMKSSFTTNFTCTTNIQVYCCNGTNQLITLPNAANTPGLTFRFVVTNGWAKVIITNSTGAQTIRDGTSLSFTQIGIGSPAFISDGAHWWPAARTRVVMPNAQFSCTTNIPLTAANTAYPVTFNSTDFDYSQGIVLGAGTNGLLSKMWITNSGEYIFLPSIVESFSGANTIRYWFRSNDTNVPNSGTPALGAAAGTIRVITVAFRVHVTAPTAFEIWAQSTSTGDTLSAEAASGNYPASPSVICPVQKISDLWP